MSTRARFGVFLDLLSQPGLLNGPTLPGSVPSQPSAENDLQRLTMRYRLCHVSQDATINPTSESPGLLTKACELAPFATTMNGMRSINPSSLESLYGKFRNILEHPSRPSFATKKTICLRHLQLQNRRQRKFREIPSILASVS